MTLEGQDLITHMRTRLTELRRPGGVFDNRDTEIKLIEDFLADVPPEEPVAVEPEPVVEESIEDRVNAGETSVVYEVFAGEATAVGEIATEADVAPEAAPEPEEAPAEEQPKPAPKPRAKRTAKPKNP